METKISAALRSHGLEKKNFTFTFHAYRKLIVGWCAGRRNGEVLTLLVRRGGKPSLNHPEWSRQSKGASPLHTAARLGQVANAQVLLELGADVNVVDASGQTPLHVAAVHEITGQKHARAAALPRGRTRPPHFFPDRGCFWD